MGTRRNIEEKETGAPYAGDTRRRRDACEAHAMMTG